MSTERCARCEATVVPGSALCRACVERDLERDARIAHTATRPSRGEGEPPCPATEREFDGSIMRCRFAAGHDGMHDDGCVLWNDPPVADAFDAPVLTTAEVQERIARADRTGLATHTGDATYSDGYNDGRLDERASVLRDAALPLAKRRDRLAAELEVAQAFHKVAVGERDLRTVECERLKAEVERLRGVIAAKYAIERSSLGKPALIEDRESAIARAEAAERDLAETLTKHQAQVDALVRARNLARADFREVAAAVMVDPEGVPASVVIHAVHAAVADRVRLREVEQERQEAVRDEAQRLLRTWYSVTYERTKEEQDTNEQGRALDALCSYARTLTQCGIRAHGGAIGVAACDLPKGHDGDLHANGGDGFYAAERIDEHRANQALAKAKAEKVTP